MLGTTHWLPLTCIFALYVVCLGQHIDVTDLNSLQISGTKLEQNKYARRNQARKLTANVIPDEEEEAAADTESMNHMGGTQYITKQQYDQRGIADVARNAVSVEGGESKTSLTGSRGGNEHGQTVQNSTDSAIGSTQVEREEEKLHTATVKLVLWLRNRLRKRIQEVADLEQEMEREKILLENLRSNIENTTAAREGEIRLKLKTEKKLTAFRRTIEEPEKQLQLIQSQTKKLSDKLAHLVEVYNSLSERHRELRQHLHEAGFSHWLQARGKEYMPETAVGILSKSVELFEPFSDGLEKAVELEHDFAQGVEEVVPIPKDNFFEMVFEDMLLILPMIPILVAVCKLFQAMHSLSVIHVVMYIAAAFCAESSLLLLVSFCLGSEPLSVLQGSHESMLVLGIFMNVSLYVIYLFTQGLIAVLKTSRLEILQTSLALAIGYHCYKTIFRPVMLDQKVSSTATNYVMYIINFLLVVYEKKRILKIKSPYEEQVNEFLLSIEKWFWETVEAMNHVFYERSEETEVYSDGSTISSTEYAGTESGDDRQPPEAEAKVSTGSPEDVPAPRGRRSYETWSGTRMALNPGEYYSNVLNPFVIPSARRSSQTAAPIADEPIENDERVVQSNSQKMHELLGHAESNCSTLYASCRE